MAREHTYVNPQAFGQARSKAFIPAVTAGVLLITGFAGFALWRAGEPAATFPAAPSPVAAASRGTAAAAKPSTRQSPAALDPARFIEPAQAGRLAYSGGDYEQAAGLYEDAVAQRPQDAEAWSNLGQALVKLNRTEEALAKFERAIELNPDRWAYHFNLARAQGLLGNWEVAVREYRVAQQLFPDDYATAFNLGLALGKAGDNAGAVEAFKRAIEIDPQDPTFHLSLAAAYEKLGQVADAIAEYERTVELAGPAPEVPAILSRIRRLKGESEGPPAVPTEGAAKKPAPQPESGR